MTTTPTTSFSRHLFFFFFFFTLSNTNIITINAIPTPKPKPNLVFQVTQPIPLPNTVPCKQLLLDHHEFAPAQPSILVDYSGPPSLCAASDSTAFSKIVLEWSGTCNGTQDDSVFGVWLGGVELLRSTPPQPFNTSVSWKARKDITRYSSLLLDGKHTQKLAVFFRNTLDTGVYHVTISISFYPDHQKSVENRIESKADLILPISRNRNLHSKDGGLWFEIHNSTDSKQTKFKIPQNSYRAVLEVYVSPHSTDRFWYSNYLPEYYNSNQFVDRYANGPFRDVVVNLDGALVGAIWPYPVTAGAGSGMWNPIASIRNFDLPSYDLELTPYLGNLLDGGAHNLSFGVGNAIDVWFVGANLHIWLDHKSIKTEGKLVANQTQPPLDLSSTMKMKGLDGESWVEAQRMISSQGWVKSSYGNITVRVTQNLSYANYIDMEFEANVMGNRARVEQLILWNDSVSFVDSESVSDYSVVVSKKRFGLSTGFEQVGVLEGEEGDFITTNNVTLGYSDDKMEYGKYSAVGFSKMSSLKDEQTGSSVRVAKNYTWLSKLQDMKQSYKYVDEDGGNMGRCYSRNTRSLNSTIVLDDETSKCV